MAKKRASEESLSPAKRQRDLFSPEEVTELRRARDEWLTLGNMPQTEAAALVAKCSVTKAQVQNWFANANRRAKRCAAEGLLLLSDKSNSSDSLEWSERLPPLWVRPSEFQDFHLAMMLGTIYHH